MTLARLAATTCAAALSFGAATTLAAPIELEPSVANRPSYGAAVAQDARWIFIGDAPPRDPGKVWIYEKTTTGPVFRQVLDGNEAFGCSIAVSTDEIAVGECLGTALRIFAFDGTKWVQKTVLTETTGIETLGMGIAYDGPDKLIVGGLKFPIVSLYTRSAGTWTRVGQITAPYAAQEFGTVARRFGDELVIVGYTLTGGSVLGQVQLYKRSGTTWVTDGPVFPKVGGQAVTTIEKIGTQYLVGDPSANIASRAWAGATYVFSRAGSSWNLDQTLVSGDPQPRGAFGGVAASGTLVVTNDPGMRESRGLVRTSAWTQVAPRKLVPKNSNAIAGAMSLLGSTLVVGNTTEIGSGSAFVVDLTCTKDDDCGPGTFCDSTGLCGARAVAGAACNRDVMCSSGFCTDGVCCESRCEGVCEACDVAGSAGACLAVKGTPHQTTTTKRPSCPQDAADACTALTCDGLQRATCAQFAGADVVCRSSSCVGASSTAEARCDGSGKCPAAAVSSCGGYVCDESSMACRTTCASRFDCAAGYACKAGRCTKLAGSCGADGASVVAADGTVSSCNRFVCVDGECLTKCTRTMDCGVGSACDVGTGACVEAAGASEDAGGCAVGRPVRTTGLWLLMLLCLGRAARSAQKEDER